MSNSLVALLEALFRNQKIKIQIEMPSISIRSRQLKGGGGQLEPKGQSHT